jgi:hypothetical protein
MTVGCYYGPCINEESTARDFILPHMALPRPQCGSLATVCQYGIPRTLLMVLFPSDNTK